MKFLYFLIILFLFPYIQASSSYSCEELQKQVILEHVIGKCGEEKFQLDCKGNEPIFYMQSTTFLVKDISFQNKSFRLVDPAYSTTGNHCHLPNQAVTRDHALYRFFLYYSNVTIINFLICTQEIEDPKYKQVPCLNRTNSRVYAVASRSFSYAVSKVHDSCSLVGRAMTNYIDEPLEDVGYAYVVQAIEKGILVKWMTRRVYWKGLISCSYFEVCSKRMILPFKQWKGFSEVLLLSLRPASFLPLLLYMVSSFLGCLYTSFNTTISFTLSFTVLFGIVLLMLLARIFLTPLAICSFLIHKRWRTSLSVSAIGTFLRRNELLHVKRYDFSEISIMTNHFREKLGQGGFGSVYKGRLLNSQHVAIKILSNHIGDGDDFISEVATIGRIHHTNVVRLIGFCSEGSRRALIYAYMPNGSLDKYIFSSGNNALSMEKRREIATGIARGIDYIHRGCEMQILHFDIKPHNILLDHNLVPKISDFGLARLYPKENSLVTLSMARGTIGYIAPELISRTFGAISYKADVYSFGMLLMEMVSGRRNVNNHAESSGQVYYPSWIYDQLNHPIEPHNLSNDVGRFGEIEERLYKVALWCIQMKASNRPTMTRVIEMLQNDSNSLEMPPRPSMICTPREFSMRSSGNESCSIELSLILEEISML